MALRACSRKSGSSRTYSRGAATIAEASWGTWKRPSTTALGMRKSAPDSRVSWRRSAGPIGDGFPPQGRGLLGSATRTVAARVGLLCRLALAVDPRCAGPLAGSWRHGCKRGGPMTLNELRYIVAVAQERSFGRAAG